MTQRIARVVFHHRASSTKKWMIPDERKQKLCDREKKKPRTRKRRLKQETLGENFDYETIPELWLSAHNDKQ